MVGRTEDRAIPGPAGEIGVRIYWPVNSKNGPLPLVVYYHDGGFVRGDLETHDLIARAVCDLALAARKAAMWR